MYNFKEKKKHFNALLNPDAAKYDLELLIQRQPHLPVLATYSRTPKRYANDILYLLLDYATREEIREFRRSRLGGEVAIVPPSVIAATQMANTVDNETSPVQPVGAFAESSEKVEKEEPEIMASGVEDEVQTVEKELQQLLDEETERANEAEQAAEEAEDARIEAEARAEAAEEALEREKKKEKATALAKSKSKKNTRKSTGTTSSTHKSK